MKSNIRSSGIIQNIFEPIKYALFIKNVLKV